MLIELKFSFIFFSMILNSGLKKLLNRIKFDS
jgi:hypothetical protein